MGLDDDLIREIVLKNEGQNEKLRQFFFSFYGQVFTYDPMVANQTICTADVSDQLIVERLEELDT
jgi:hypothetical protein